MKRILCSLLCVLLLTAGLSLAPKEASAAEQSVRVLLSTGAKSTVTVEAIGEYTVGGAAFTGGTYTVTASNGSVKLTHSQGGALYSGAEVTLLRQAGADAEAYLCIATAGGTVRKYLGDLKLYASGDTVKAVNIVDIRQYISGVAVPEVGRNADTEVLKAACIAAKGFALAEVAVSKSSPYDLGDTTSDQIYYGYYPTADKVLAAAEEVYRQTLLYNGAVFKTHYASSNGGVMLTPKNRWGGGSAYSGAYACRYDPFDLLRLDTSADLTIAIDGASPQTLPKALYNYLLSLGEGAVSGTVTGIKAVTALEGYNNLGNADRYPASYAPQDGFKITMLLERKSASAISCTVDVSFDTLQSKGVISTNSGVHFVAAVAEGSWRLCYGVSSGPRVGISHKGAALMAAYGYSYVDILAYYYPGAVLTDSDGSTILSSADLSAAGILKTVTGSANPNVTQWGTVNEDDTNFRLESNTDCDSSARLLKGTPLGIYKKSGDWYFCMNLDTGVQGWVYASYVTLTAGPTAAPSPTATASPTATPTAAVTASPVPAPTLSTVQPTLRGDINGDGVVGSADASMALRYSVKLEYLNEYQLLVADVNNDGKVSAPDASRILRYVVKLIDVL